MLYERLEKKNARDLERLSNKLTKRIQKADKRSVWLTNRIKKLKDLFTEIMRLIAEMQVGVEMLYNKKRYLRADEKLNTDYQVREMESLREKLLGE